MGARAGRRTAILAHADGELLRCSSMRVWLLAVALGGLAGATTAAAAPSRTPLQRCFDGCTSSQGTDASTCRLQCREADSSKQTPNRVDWKRTEYKGGSPDPSAPRGTETVVVETSPNGTTVSVGRDASAERAYAARNPRPDDGTPRQRHRADHGWCALGCGTWSTASARLACRAGCRPQRAPKPAVRSTAKKRPPPPAKKTPPTKAQRAECVRACGVHKSSCTDECGRLRGSNKVTCRLQCDQDIDRCHRRCSAPR